MTIFSRLFVLPFWLKIFHSFLHACQRFPLTMLAIIAINLIVIDDIHNFNLLNNKQSGNIFLIALGGAFWFAATALLAESLRWTKRKYYLLTLPVFFLYGWHVVQQNTMTLESAVLILASGLFITFAAWLFRRDDNASVWYFNYQLIAAICFALLSAVIFCGGISLILASVEYLFEINIRSRIYQDTWLIGMVFLAPSYFLANIPKQFDYPRSDCQFPSGVHFILTYILVPLALVYMIILYAYFIKISVQMALPHGHLGKMISAFGIIGIITHLAIYPLHDRTSSILSWFYKYFYLMLIVPLGLLSLAIGVRISQYGFTEQRYLVALCAVWFAILIISFLVKRQQFQLKYVTISLALLSTLISFGPWGIHQLPISSQLSRLEAILINENLFTSGVLDVREQPSLENQKSISSIVEYLIKHDAENRLRPWIEDKQAFDKLVDCYDPMFCRHSAEQLVTLMGINYVNYWEDIHSDYIEITINNLNQDKRALAIAGYDILIPISWLSFNEYDNSSEEPFVDADFTLVIDQQNQFTFSNKDGTSIQFNLAELAAQFLKTGSTTVEAEQADKLILTQTGQGIEAKLYVDVLGIAHDSSEITFITLTGFLLIKYTSN